MEPIPIYFENVRRSALVLKPKQPFKDWLVSLDSGDIKVDITNNSDVYLLPDFEELKQIESWLKRNYDQIFCDQMNNWYVDDSVWIQNRTYRIFKEWFDYSIHTMIWDTMDIPIEKE